MKKPNFTIERKDSEKKILYIRDVGPWDQFPTVTNGAEDVVDALVKSHILEDGYRLLYFDSDDSLDEILIKDGAFAGFAPGPQEGKK
jgi:hypothetical protein